MSSKPKQKSAKKQRPRDAGRSPSTQSSGRSSGSSASPTKTTSGAVSGSSGGASAVPVGSKDSRSLESVKGAVASSMSATPDTTACKEGTREASCDRTAPVKKQTSTREVVCDRTSPVKKQTSKDEVRGGGGAGEEVHKESLGIAPSAKKPSTKAERRALQEAQRKAKAERQIASSKAGQTAREEKLAKEGKAGGPRTSGGAGGEEKQHQMSAHLTRSTVSKPLLSHSVPGLKKPQHFTHLPQFERKARVTNLLKDYHPPPCILQLGLQYSEQLVCGSNARCVAMLAAFKRVIQDYTTPPEKELRRDLDSFIKPHINFLAQCRPLSVSMGNAIKHLKLQISQIPPDTSDSDAKKSLCDMIDSYIQEKIELAGKAISEFCLKMIDDGDVILVHAHSSVVQCCLIDAHRSGKKFRVIVVDSRPKMEGEECLRQLIGEGIKCAYVLISAVSYIMKEVSKVIIGAHGLLANGYVMSRIGTSLIALVAKSYNVPVLVCCETYKFCDKVLTDSFVTNELGDPNDLVPIHRRQGNFLRDWKSIENLQLLNLVYDVTSPDLISMVITQLGNIPCTSVPVVLRISHGYEQM